MINAWKERQQEELFGTFGKEAAGNARSNGRQVDRSRVESEGLIMQLTRVALAVNSALLDLRRDLCHSANREELARWLAGVPTLTDIIEVDDGRERVLQQAGSGRDARRSEPGWQSTYSVWAHARREAERRSRRGTPVARLVRAVVRWLFAARRWWDGG